MNLHGKENEISYSSRKITSLNGWINPTQGSITRDIIDSVMECSNLFAGNLISSYWAGKIRFTGIIIFSRYKERCLNFSAVFTATGEGEKRFSGKPVDFQARRGRRSLQGQVQDGAYVFGVSSLAGTSAWASSTSACPEYRGELRILWQEWRIS